MVSLAIPYIRPEDVAMAGSPPWEDSGVLAVSWATVRLFLHVLAAAVWVGGQLILAAIVPVLRRFGSDALAATARRLTWA